VVWFVFLLTAVRAQAGGRPFSLGAVRALSGAWDDVFWHGCSSFEDTT
jgi:hypothetical protein